MQKENLKERFYDILDGKGTDIPLAGTVTTSPVLELMDKTGAYRPEADRDPAKMAQLAGSLHSIAGFELIRFPFDVTVLGEAMGCNIDPGTRARTPAVLSHPYKDDPGGINVPSDLLRRGRIPVVLEASGILKSKEGKNVPLIAGLEGPVDLASYLCGVKYLLKQTIKDPGLLKDIIDRCADACILYAGACIDAGADAVVIADAMASPDMVGPDAFKEIIKPAFMRIADSVDGYIISHICGKTDSIIPDLLDCGFNGISVEENVGDLKYIANLAHERNTAIIGNVSTSKTLFSGSVEDVTKESLSCIEDGVDILAPGCGIAPESPLQNLRAMVEARNEYCSE